MDKIDIFGSQILFRFQKQKRYQTRIGGYITFAIISIIIIRLITTWWEVYQRSNPNVIQKERQVLSPQKFVFDKTNTQFAFGMQEPSEYNQYIDPKIYNIQVLQITQTNLVDSKTGKTVSKYSQREIKSGPCQSDYFSNPNTQEQFRSLNYQNLYCIDPDEQIVIEGDFGQGTFNYVVIKVSKCKSDCLSDDKLDYYLLNGSFSIYFADIIVDPVIKDFPFVFFNRDLYWATSSNTAQNLSLYFRNDYVESDFGWVTSNIETNRYPQYSTQDISTSQTQGTDYFLQVLLRFEKSKENLYQRRYQTITDIISQIGGFAQSLIGFGFLLCSYFSELSLNKSLINDAFNFKLLREKNSFLQQNQQLKTLKANFSNQENQEVKDNIENQNKAQIKNESQVISGQDIQFQESKKCVQDQQNIKNFENSLHPNQSTKPLNQSQQKKSYTKNQILLSKVLQKKGNQSLELSYISEQKQKLKLPQQTSKSKQAKKNENLENQIKKMLDQERGTMEMSFLEYLKFRFWPFNKEIQKKKKIIDFSVNKLYYHIDLLHIIQKLLEVDKLKKLLMDDDQIKLFEYLPKPTIYEQDVLQQQNQDQEQQQQQQNKDIYYQDLRSESQKLQDAFESYVKISKRKRPSGLDLKILQNIDINLVQIFNIAEESMQQKEQIVSSFEQNKQMNEINLQKSQNILSQNPLIKNETEHYDNQNQKENINHNQKLTFRDNIFNISIINSKDEIKSESYIPDDEQNQQKHELNLNSNYFTNSKSQKNQHV
ncbi:ABC transporter family protein (macronuclear) [Tetrahymena thermophila SB210]|uniref:ABC transporter family protein n=1 Tax=Tetrahymena thermophila (strain SB210) TaxID=312017 RepID=Q22DD6_TETTS|nr:ABC transporter family protein [Tetrahymena thermophila SB210]EAR83266.2 ABC transporter family protein [Tetrahymena thermophila SB210]|eukprot:XP_001030929.2 ABC transporter family protein [Tetrahymena thermophila SB210]